MLKDLATFMKASFTRGLRRAQIIDDNELSFYRGSSAMSYIGRWAPLSISTIFRINATDKDSGEGHRYGRVYGRYLNKFRHKRVRMLEIGIGGYGDSIGGRSITSWRWYFPFVDLISCDIEDKSALQTKGADIRRLDQSDRAQLERLGQDGPFDIIVDDGSHISEHQILTFEILFKTLADNGVFIIEDIQTSYWTDETGQALRPSCMDYFSDLANYINACEFQGEDFDNKNKLKLAEEIESIAFFHNLIVIEKSKFKKFSNQAAKTTARSL